MAPRYLGPESLRVRARRLAIIGDTQETALVERLIGFEQNAAIRPTLLRELAARRPDGVVHLGDLVTFGSSPGHWRRLEAELAPFLEAGVPLLPVVGNHDRMLLAGLGVRQLRARFAAFSERSWYSFRYGEILFLALDSNLGAFERDAAAEQARWLAAALRAADADDAVRAVCACWHHPPVTNSTRVGPSRAGRAFVRELAGSRKAIAVFTGHCHAYERFRAGDLTLIVSGGGGGPRHTLETRPGRRRAEDLFAGGPVRFLHFLEVEPGANAMVVRVVRLARHEAGSECDVAETLELAYR